MIDEAIKNACIKIYAINESGLEGQFKKAHKYDAGYDLLSTEDYIIHARDKAIVKTGLKVLIPKGYVGIIKSRSGLAAKHDLEHGAGVIDAGYTGEVLVLLRNHSDSTYIVHKGDKIAQMLILPVPQFETITVKELPDTKRGANGFNSTGY